MKVTAESITRTLIELADADRAKSSQRFFKTGSGEYGEGDVFLGIRVPVLRAQVKQFEATPITEVAQLLKSEYHEVRLFAIFLLVRKYNRGTVEEKSTIYNCVLQNTIYINNWDLVDSSAYQIVGNYLADKDKAALYNLADSPSLWERRMSIIATYCFIKDEQFQTTLDLADILLEDEEDLIQKAVGWMLREVGNRDIEVEKSFLKPRYQRMPRTMLRYAIEKFPNDERKKYLAGSVET